MTEIFIPNQILTRIIAKLSPLDMLSSRQVTSNFCHIATVGGNRNLFSQKPNGVFVLVCPFVQVEEIAKTAFIFNWKREINRKRPLDNVSKRKRRKLTSSYEKYMLTILLQNPYIYARTKQLYIILENTVEIFKQQNMYLGDAYLYVGSHQPKAYHEMLCEIKKYPRRRSKKWPLAIDQICQTCAPTLNAFGLLSWPNPEKLDPNRSKDILFEFCGAREVYAVRKQIVPNLLRMNMLDTLFLPNISFLFNQSNDEEKDADSYGLNMMSDDDLSNASEILPRLHALYISIQMNEYWFYQMHNNGALPSVSPYLAQYQSICSRIQRLVIYGGCSISYWSDKSTQIFRDCFQNAVLEDGHLCSWHIGWLPDGRENDESYWLPNFNQNRSITIKLDSGCLAIAEEGFLSVSLLRDQIKNVVVVHSSPKWDFIFYYRPQCGEVTWKQAQAVLQYWQRPTTTTTKLSISIVAEVTPKILFETWNEKAVAIASESADDLGVEEAQAEKFLHATYDSRNMGSHTFTYEIDKPFNTFTAFDAFYEVLADALESFGAAGSNGEAEQTLTTSFYKNLKSLVIEFCYGRRECRRRHGGIEKQQNNEDLEPKVHELENENEDGRESYDAGMKMYEIALGITPAIFPGETDGQQSKNFDRYVKLSEQYVVDGCCRAMPSLCEAYLVVNELWKCQYGD